jgi:hypothetical protein
MRMIMGILRLIFNPLNIIFLIKGVVPYRWNRLSKEFLNDFFRYKKTSLKQKFWSYKKGFLSEKTIRYNLNNKNYLNYISDIDFYKKKMYKNNSYSALYDNKLTTYFILQKFSKLIPSHYIAIINNKYKLLNLEKKVTNQVEYLIQLIMEKQDLAFKPIQGGNGKGFLKISYKNSQYTINDKPIIYNNLLKLISGFNNYIVTEYVYPHNFFSDINPGPAVLRLVTIYDDNEGAQITGSTIRFGTSETNMIVDVKGSICCGVDVTDGKIYNPIMEKEIGIEPIDKHPDSGKTIKGYIPHWDLILQTIPLISNYLKITPFLTYDIIITNDNFKILEINSHGILGNMQYYYPFFLNKYQKNLFS